MVVTFFGHSNTTESIQPILYSTLKQLIENENANLFYVGNHGNFDNITIHTLKKLKFYYPHISYYVVLAYMPTRIEIYQDYETIFPECLEKTIPKYAIVKRNKWMIEQADLVITYVNKTIGGANKFKNLSERKGKRVINLASIHKQ